MIDIPGHKNRFQNKIVIIILLVCVRKLLNIHEGVKIRLSIGDKYAV